MKTRNHFIGMALIAIIALAFAIIGCKQDEPTPQEVPIGNVTIGGKTIPVYKGAGVSDVDANTTKTYLQGAFDGSFLSNVAKDYFAANVTKIEIGDTGVALNAGVLRVQVNHVTNANGMAAVLEYLYFSLVMQMFDNSRETVKMAIWAGHTPSA